MGKREEPQDVVINVDIVPAEGEEIEGPAANPEDEAPEDKKGDMSYNPNEDEGDKDYNVLIPPLGSEENVSDNKDEDNKRRRIGRHPTAKKTGGKERCGGRMG